MKDMYRCGFVDLVKKNTYKLEEVPDPGNSKGPSSLQMRTWKPGSNWKETGLKKNPKS